MGHKTLIKASSLEALTSCKIFDCRFDLANPEAGAQQYAEGHVPGAIYVNLDEVMSSPITATSGRHPLPSRESFKQFLADAGVNEGDQLVAYDSSAGLFAARFWWMSRWIGFDKVAIIDGGYPEWLKLGVTPALEQPIATSIGNIQLKDSLENALSVNEIEAIIAGEKEGIVIDVRAAERYRGEVEPIDPIAGHVPGALNIPLSENYAANGLFKAPTELAASYRKTLGVYKANEPVFMCGSGVTACLGRFAIEIAGLEAVSVYPGSWSEWIRDSNRGVATGE
jgi:thiosulfate/3-mercaptopyruvate sulfurtransferase